MDVLWGRKVYPGILLVGKYFIYAHGPLYEVEDFEDNITWTVLFI